MKNHKDMIEVTVKCTSPWKSVMIKALDDCLTARGWTVRQIESGADTVFIGVENEKR